MEKGRNERAHLFLLLPLHLPPLPARPTSPLLAFEHSPALEGQPHSSCSALIVSTFTLGPQQQRTASDPLSTNPPPPPRTTFFHAFTSLH